MSGKKKWINSWKNYELKMVQQIINMKKIIILVLIAISFSSCYTIQEMTMSNNKKATQCAWFE